MTDNSTKNVYSDPLFSVPSFDACVLDSVHDVSKLRFIEDSSPKWVFFREYTYLAHYKFTTKEGLIRAWVSLKSKRPFTEEEKASVYQRISESRTNLLHAVKEYRNKYFKETTPQEVSNKRWDQWCAENPGAQECKMYDV